MSRMQRLRPLAGLVAAMGLAAPALAAPSQRFPTYATGPQADGSFVVGSGQVITPAGVQVALGNNVRAKAIALQPNSHFAAVLTMGASTSVQVFDTQTGNVVQTYAPFGSSYGSYAGISYSADGKWLLFSQDYSYKVNTSGVARAKVNADGTLSDDSVVALPPDTSFIKCFPNSAIGAYGRPCATLYSTWTSYPGSLAMSQDGKSAYVLLNNNNTLASLDLTQTPPAYTGQIPVGIAPHSVLVNGSRAYVSNEGGRQPTANDFTLYSAGSQVVADKVSGSAITGNVSLINLAKKQVVATIKTGLHPTGMAMFGPYLLVANAYSDSISVIDTATNNVVRTIEVSLPIQMPLSKTPAFGAQPVSIAVDRNAGVAYVALYLANAIAVVDLSGATANPILGLIPTAFAPASVVLDSANNKLIVANDKGIGTRLSFETDYGVTGYNTHQDNGTVSIIPLPTVKQLAAWTKQVFENNHWDLVANIVAAGFPNPAATPVAIPARIGEPSLIKHVFLIIKENRTYDQILGDVAAGNGDKSLAVFGADVTPNFHELVKRFPLFDNFYTPSRQSADGHQWIVEGMAPYADDIQSPDWVRSYPGGNAGDALAYTQKGFLFQTSVREGRSTKIYGEYVENEYWPGNGGQHPHWPALYKDALQFEAAYAINPATATLQYADKIAVECSVPAVDRVLVKNFPQFDMDIPDQWRVDVWLQDFDKDLAANNVPALSILWVTDDHTGGPPTSRAMQADNDLATARIVDYISHSKVWKNSAIFIEEDDSQNGVDHVDGHRSTAYVVSPYAVQNGPTNHTYYTQVNMTRTIEQILGLPPMNQFDLVATPMFDAFTNTANFAPWNHVPNTISLTEGVSGFADAVTPDSAISKAWAATKLRMFAGKSRRPDSVDADTLNHFNWYETTGFKRPYPGENNVRMPTEFANRFRTPIDLDD